MDELQLARIATERIKTRLKQLGWTQKRLAAEIGRGEPHVSRVLRGNRPIEMPTLNLIAEALKVKVETLLTMKQDDRPLYRIPRIGRTAAGCPIDPKHEPHDFLPVHELYKGDVWAVEVSGDSMLDAMIADGDHVVVRRQPSAETGERVLAWVGDNHDGGFTLKLKTRRTDRATGKSFDVLAPENRTMDAEYIPLDGSVPVTVFGVYLGLIRSVRPNRGKTKKK